MCHWQQQMKCVLAVLVLFSCTIVTCAPGSPCRVGNHACPPWAVCVPTAGWPLCNCSALGRYDGIGSCGPPDRLHGDTVSQHLDCGGACLFGASCIACRCDCTAIGRSVCNPASLGGPCLGGCGPRGVCDTAAGACLLPPESSYVPPSPLPLPSPRCEP